MKNVNEKKIRKGGLVRLNEFAVEKAENLTRYSGETPAIWGKSKFTAEDAAAYRADIQKQIEECKAAGTQGWRILLSAGAPH